MTINSRYGATVGNLRVVEKAVVCKETVPEGLLTAPTAPTQEVYVAVTTDRRRELNARDLATTNGRLHRAKNVCATLDAYASKTPV